MYFCDKCSYKFDISKSSNIKINDPRTIINKIPDVLKLLEDKADLSNYKASFNKEEMTKNKKFQKLNEIDKIKVIQIFEDLQTSGADFKCNNCNYSKSIVETTLLYQYNVNSDNIKILNIEDNKLMVNDPTLPHTHDYTCKNIDCITHKDNKKKDAIFYKDNNNYKVNYICTLCYYNW